MPPVDWLASLDPRVLGGTSFALGAIFGAFVSHRFNLRRDRRSEYNELVRPIRERMLDVGGRTHHKLPSRAELDSLAPLMSRRRFRRLREAMENYDLKREQQYDAAAGDRGGIYNRDVPSLQLATHRLLKAMPLR